MLRIYHKANTKEKMIEAQEMKCDMIEIDIQLFENKLVLSHDPVIDTKEFITLNEAINLMYGKRIFLDIKTPFLGDHKEMVTQLLNIIDIEYYKKYIIISSFDHRIIKELYKVRPELNYGMTIEAMTDGLTNIKYLIINYKSLSESIIDYANLNNLKLMVYTVNDKRIIDIIKKYNIYGIISDYPNLL